MEKGVTDLKFSNMMVAANLFIKKYSLSDIYIKPKRLLLLFLKKVVEVECLWLMWEQGTLNLTVSVPFHLPLKKLVDILGFFNPD